MKYDFDRIIDRTGTNSEKWDCVKRYFPKAKENALPLWVADMDFACAKPIQEALHARIDKEIYGYTDPDDMAYKEAVHGWFVHRFDWDFDIEDMFYSPGVVPALSYLIQILSKEGQGIVIQEPVYHPFARTIQYLGREPLRNQLVNTEGIYQIDFADLEEKLKGTNTAGMILCSPHNPVGRVWKKDELRRIVDLAVRYEKWIISDEIHCDIVRKSHQHIPLAKLCPEAQNRIITCTAPSKSFNLAGLKNSNIIIHNPAYKELWRKEIMEKQCILEPNGFAHVATIAAYRDSEDWLDQVNVYIDANIAYVNEMFSQYLPKAVVSPCEGTYLMWVDMRAYGKDAKELEDRMQKEAGVLLDEGYIFGAAGSGFERINCACPRSILQKAIERIIKAFA